MKHGLLTITESDLLAAEEWLGNQVDVVTTTYSQNLFHDGIDGITWDEANRLDVMERLFGNSSRQLAIAYEFGGPNRNEYGRAASGEFDADYRNFAQQLVDRGMGDSIIRMSHEFNLSWNSKYPSDPQNYADGFARCVDVMQSVSGANFDFCFSPARNRLGVAPDAWPVDSAQWPSGEPAPIITPSLYDSEGGTYPDDISGLSDSELEQLWQDAWVVILDKIQMWENFGAERGANRFGTAEWGVATNAYPNPSGGDNPYFVEKLLDYGISQGWELQAYWNTASASGGSHQIYPDSTALTDASNMYQSIVSQQLTNTSTDDTSSDTTDDTSTSTYGGYNTPQAGSNDWHIPLNENFESIEADIQDLADRINNLEQT